MSKQKILILVGILVLLVIAGFFYFLIKKDSGPIIKEEIPNTPLTQEEINAKVREDLNSFQRPVDSKSDAEIYKELNKPTPKEKLLNKSDEQVKQDLLNITP